MNPIVKNILAVVGGAIIGGIVNSLIVSISGSMVPLPEGVDPSDIESIKSNLHLYETKHFIMPFIAHAVGTLVGGYIAAKFAASHKLKMALIVGALFLVGGLMMVFMVGGPTWFIVLDLLVAYLPMAWLGAKLAKAA